MGRANHLRKARQRPRRAARVNCRAGISRSWFSRLCLIRGNHCPAVGHSAVRAGDELSPNSEVEIYETNVHAAGARRLRRFDVRMVWCVRMVRDVGRLSGVNAAPLPRRGEFCVGLLRSSDSVPMDRAHPDTTFRGTQRRWDKTAPSIREPWSRRLPRWSPTPLRLFQNPAPTPNPLPLLHRMEERAGERRRVLLGIPRSSILSPLVPRGERKGQRRVLKEPPLFPGKISRPAALSLGPSLEL